MSGRRAKQARRESGAVKPPKVPTPVLERSHTWRTRWNPEKRRTEIRPSRVALDHGYGIKDLGWQPEGKYFGLRGRLNRRARA